MTCNEFFKEPNFWEIFGFLLTALAVIFYFVKPCLSACLNIDDERNIAVTVYNNNVTPKMVIDVHCEICLSRDENFTQVKTLKLQKANTLAIKKPPHHYIFKTEVPLPADVDDNYSHCRIRILAPNIIGIRKLLIDEIRAFEANSHIRL